MGPTWELVAGQCGKDARTADNLLVVSNVQVCQ